MSSYNHFGCSWCGGPFNGGNCPGCSSVGSGNEFVYNPNPYSYNETPNFFNQPPQPQYETYSCELCGNDSHYGFDCPPRVPLVYEQEPCYNQNFSDNYYPQNSPSFSQQYLCCDNCGGPHATFQCHPMNQNFNSFGFDHIQPPQQFDNHQPQEIPEVTPFVENDDEELLFAITTCFTKRGTTITLKYGGISSILTLFCDNENRNSKGIYVEPLNDEEIISDKIDASIISSPKIDSFLEQFSGELAHIDLIPREVNEAQLDPEG
ncbi:hypothetical protein Tco_0966173 [Tanacetum coccineum]